MAKLAAKTELEYEIDPTKKVNNFLVNNIIEDAKKQYKALFDPYAKGNLEDLSKNAPKLVGLSWKELIEKAKETNMKSVSDSIRNMWKKLDTKYPNWWKKD